MPNSLGPKRPAIALLIETSNAYARGLLEGITAYIREHENWSVFLPEQGRGGAPPAWLEKWQGNGIIARIENDAIASAVRRAKLPAIDVSAGRRLPQLPWVETDDRAIAETAAEHLLQRGFTQLAYCGDPAFNWSRWREDHFTAYVRERGLECAVYRASHKTRGDWQAEQDRLMAWLRTLPHPTGILACYDIQAQRLLDACRSLQIAAPEEIAVVGVDNDELLCRLATPSLSSVIPDTYRTGYEAAALLDRAMRGEPVAAEAHLIPPLGVATRQSTDTLAIDDADVALALRYIREHAYEGISVDDVLRAVPLSRRALESRFRQTLGRTPYQEIIRLRIDRVKRLLIETDLNLDVIAKRTGFSHVEYMSVAFKRIVGQPPSVFRKEHYR